VARLDGERGVLTIFFFQPEKRQSVRKTEFLKKGVL